MFCQRQVLCTHSSLNNDLFKEIDLDLPKSICTNFFSKLK